MKTITLRKGTGQLSSGTPMDVLGIEHGIATVRTASPIPVVDHKSWFDQDGRQQHAANRTGQAKLTIEVPVTDLVIPGERKPVMHARTTAKGQQAVRAMTTKEVAALLSTAKQGTAMSVMEEKLAVACYQHDRRLG